MQQNRAYRRHELDQAKPIVHEIFLSLEEISTGCTKNMRIAAKVFDDDRVVRTEEKIVKVDVQAGTKDGTRMIVPFAGDQKPGIIPADVIFVIREREHEFVTRDEENNLIYKARISLQEALTGLRTRIQLPWGEALSLSTNDVVSHGTCKRIPGKGLPRVGGDRGDLLVQFSVVFPVNLTQEQRCTISSILKD